MVCGKWNKNIASKLLSLSKEARIHPSSDVQIAFSVTRYHTQGDAEECLMSMGNVESTAARLFSGTFRDRSSFAPFSSIAVLL